MNKKEYTGFLTHRVTCAKNSTIQVEYLDAQRPNYFKVSNSGTSPLYCSTSGYPTLNKFDFKVDGGKSKIFNEPYARDRIYIYNPSLSEDINVIVTSMYAPFDTTVFALSELGMEITGTVETDGLIKGFEVSLPEGNNKIGSVELGDTSLNRIDDMCTSLDNVESLLADIKSNQQTEGSNITLIKTNTANIYNLLNQTMEGVLLNLQSIVMNTASSGNSVRSIGEKTVQSGSSTTLTCEEYEYISSVYHSKGAISSVTITKNDGSTLSISCQDGDVSEVNELLKLYKPSKISVGCSDSGTIIHAVVAR